MADSDGENEEKKRKLMVFYHHTSLTHQSIKLPLAVLVVWPGSHNLDTINGMPADY